MDGYTATSYGDAFADVYDDWYAGVSDVAATVELVNELAGDGRRVLELGVGTGRLAVPMVDRGLTVAGVDASPAMLERLRARDPDGRIRIVAGDMVDDLPAGPFDVVLVAYNTLFNLPTASRQAACFAAVADRLSDHGSFVVEAFVPADPPPHGSSVEVRSMSAAEVVLSVSVHDGADQRASGQFVHLADGQPVRLRPWAIRYASPDELDAMATAAHLVCVERWEDVGRTTFGPASQRHLSVYRRA